MSDGGSKSDGFLEGIAEKWRAMGEFGRTIVAVSSAVGVLGAAAAVGWASHDRWERQQGLPGRMDTMEARVFGADIPGRLRAVEADVDSLERAMERRRREMNAIRDQLDNLESLAGRILCVVEGNEPCIDPNGND